MWRPTTTALLALSRGNGEIVWMPTLTSRPAPQLVVESGQVIVPLISGDLAIFSQKDGKVINALGALPASGTAVTGGAAAVAAPGPAAPPAPVSGLARRW